MRVIAGEQKGRRLTSPHWAGVRPTSDKLRETLFNVLGPHVAGARVLDGFAGTGAVGIEALSRGARHVTFVDSDRRATALVEANLSHCGLKERYAIIRVDFARLSSRLEAATPDGFDIIFLDPPYGAAGHGVGARSGRRTGVGQHAGNHRARAPRRAASAGRKAGADTGFVVGR